MKIDADQIEKVSVLARLELSQEEKAEFSEQLSEILSYVEKIKELDTKNISPADHIVELSNVFREDIIRESIKITAIEKFAPDFDESHFIVPKVIE